MEVTSNGHLFALSQVTNYVCRGEALEDMNVMDFLMETYIEKIPRQGRKAAKSRHSAEDPESDGDTEDMCEGPSQRGRHRNQQIPYMHDHPKHTHECRIK